LGRNGEGHFFGGQNNWETTKFNVFPTLKKKLPPEAGRKSIEIIGRPPLPPAPKKMRTIYEIAGGNLGSLIVNCYDLETFS
jgi:hypothetical protein